MYNIYLNVLFGLSVNHLLLVPVNVASLYGSCVWLHYHYCYYYCYYY